MISVGIIGQGSFGRFVAEKLADYFEVKTYDSYNIDSKWATSFEEVARCKYVVLAVPLGSYQEVLNSLMPLVNEETVLIDVCSVKEKSVEIIKSILPEVQLVATHPMFGPESAAESLEGHDFILCPEVSVKSAYDKIKEFALKLKLNVVEISAEEHDKEIAVVQGLTFFVARALDQIGLHKQKLKTPSFGRLLHLAELEKHHSMELFKTIQQGNKYTKEVRENFLKVTEELNGKISD